jgi:hypothetical protein
MPADRRSQSSGPLAESPCRGGPPHPSLATCWGCRDHLERCHAQRDRLERFDLALADIADRWRRGISA